MYIQPHQNEAPVIPEGYSGNAFPREPAPPAPEEAPAQEVREAPREAPQDDPPAAEAFAPQKERGREEHAPHARFPFLSALLPPKRREGKGGLPDWAILAAVAVLFFSEEGESDILPFLLLLLLWD